MLAENSPMPSATVSYMEDEEIKQTDIQNLLSNGTYILVGVPGVFTPVCTDMHLPTLIKASEKIKKQGVKEIYCISDDNPWAIEQWKKMIKNHKHIKFLSDGNRDLLDLINLRSNEDFIFIKGKYARFFAVIKDNIVKHITVEDTVLDTEMTNGQRIQDKVSEYMACVI